MVSLRIPPTKLALIDAAARALGKKRTSFLLDVAVERAENVILDRRLFALDESSTAALREILDRPATPVPALRALMGRQAPWE
jgi:uncharacterized protein (DUF1778 family)